MLTEQRRTQLDNIVQQMVQNKEPDDVIQFVVDDFKIKYENETEQIEKPGVFRGIGEDFTKRADLTQQAVDQPDITLPERGLRVAGQAAGLATDILGRGLSAITPEFIEEPLKKGVQKIAETAPVQSVVEKYEEWKTAHPRAAANLEAGVNIASLLPIGVGAKVGGKEALSVAGGIAGKAATKIEASLAKQTFEEALDIIKPVLTRKEKIGALEKGRGLVTKKLLPRRFETVSLTPTAKEIEMANTVKGIVSKSKNQIDNIESLADTSYEIGQKIRTGLEQSDAIWNKNELKSKLKNIEKPITVKSDITINNQANNFTRAILELAETADKKAVGILDVRQEFDNLVQKEFPNLYDKEMTPMRQYISSMRRTLNEFAESKLPEGKLPDGTSIKAEWRRQHLMLDSIENIAEKTASVVDTSVTKRAMSALRQNPFVSGFTGGILTFGAITGMLSNPVIIGGIILGGTYKIGQTIITSRTLKESLLQVLRALESAGKTIDANAIKDMVNELPD